MSMLKYFFEIGSDSTLFHELEISNEKDLCDKYMAKFPVIAISLKNVESDTFETAKKKICSCIGDEAILLIDEYNVPLDKAYQSGYYDAMIKFIRALFGQVLKTNNSLYFAVLTGCLKLSHESILTGLNNFKVYTVKELRYKEYFGFTDTEIKKMLVYYGFVKQYPSTKEWYDGYQFGNLHIYCPWDVINYCADLIDENITEPQNYCKKRNPSGINLQGSGL